MTVKTKAYSRAIERNLLACYYRANAYDLESGVNWYTTAHEISARLAESHGISLKQACGVIAALSPGNSWERNVLEAEEFISQWMLGARGRQLPIVGVYGRRNIAKTIKILQGKEPLSVLGGDKVRSFYSNILDPSNESPVTIDRHAKCCCFGVTSGRDAFGLVRPSEYEYLAEHFRNAASKVDLTPCQFQAICWVTWRRLEGVLAQCDLDLTEAPDWVTSDVPALA